MKSETLILANILDEKIKAIENKIEDLKEKDIVDVVFSERFTDSDIVLDSDDEDDANDIKAIISSYIDTLSKKLVKLQEEFNKL